jgi:hypothetical protein
MRCYVALRSAIYHGFCCSLRRVIRDTNCMRDRENTHRLTDNLLQLDISREMIRNERENLCFSLRQNEIENEKERERENF